MLRDGRQLGFQKSMTTGGSREIKVSRFTEAPLPVSGALRRSPRCLRREGECAELTFRYRRACEQVPPQALDSAGTDVSLLLSPGNGPSRGCTHGSMELPCTFSLVSSVQSPPPSYFSGKGRKRRTNGSGITGEIFLMFLRLGGHSQLTAALKEEQKKRVAHCIFASARAMPGPCVEMDHCMGCQVS